MFLLYRIQGKEDSILTYEEEAENFKDRNYRQKEKVIVEEWLNTIIQHLRKKHSLFNGRGWLSCACFLCTIATELRPADGSDGLQEGDAAAGPGV